jgi:hypothetical protein
MKRLNPAFSPRLCLKLSVGFSIVFAGSVEAQQRDTVQSIQRAFEQLVATTRAAAVFPGFRPDTMAYAFVLPNRGTLLLNWRGTLPTGFVAIPGVSNAGWHVTSGLGAASTNIEIAGRAVAQLVVDKLDTRLIAPLAAHEAFHVFQTVARSAHSYMGERENSFMVSSYPVYDTINEANIALEGVLLERALSAHTVQQARAFARQFSAVRASRQRKLGHGTAEFEQKTEGNEGLAEYALLRTRNAIDGVAPGLPPQSLLQDLRRLTTDLTRSIRLRYYLTGSAQAFLLDRIDPEWKNTFLEERVFLDELIARASGALASEQEARKRAEAQQDMGALQRAAGSQLNKLQALRSTQIDSIMSRPGVQLIVDMSALPNRDIGWCGIDPQNLLQASPRILLHTRWLRACSGRALDAELNTPAIQDRDAAELKAVIDPNVAITAGGQSVTLEEARTVELADVRVLARDFNGRFERAELTRTGNRLRIKPRI